MEKYLSLTVTAGTIAGGQRIIPCTGIVSVVQASATQVDVFYNTAAAAQSLMMHYLHMQQQLLTNVMQ